MSQKLKGLKDGAEATVRDIRRRTRKQYSAEEKIRIVVAGLRGEDSIAELCRREGIAESLYYSWSKEFLEAGKKRLAGDTARQASSVRSRICAARCATSRRRLPNRCWKTGC
jgi:transposase